MSTTHRQLGNGFNNITENFQMNRIYFLGCPHLDDASRNFLDNVSFYIQIFCLSITNIKPLSQVSGPLPASAKSPRGFSSVYLQSD